MLFTLLLNHTGALVPYGQWLHFLRHLCLLVPISTGGRRRAKHRERIYASGILRLHPRIYHASLPTLWTLRFVNHKRLHFPDKHIATRLTRFPNFLWSGQTTIPGLGQPYRRAWYAPARPD